jgi:chromosome segregation ATPase
MSAQSAMNAVPDNQPEVVNFPDPRPPRQRIALKKPTIDNILSRMSRQDTSERVMVDEPLEAAPVEMEPIAETPTQEEPDFKRLQAETNERIRVARELEILLSARENLLENREALLSRRQGGVEPPADEFSSLEQSLNETQRTLKHASQTLADMEGTIASLRSEVDNLKRSGSEVEVAPGESLTTYDGVTDPSLAEQVAFLKEREAFIEESENTLFDKAQTLQEWETRLEQKEHDGQSR